MARANRRPPRLLFFIGANILAACVGLGSSGAQQLTAGVDQQRQDAPRKPGVMTAAVAPSESPSSANGKPVQRTGAVAKGPFYVDFRARTAASYGHAFVWFGKTSQKQVEVAGLHPAGDTLPYVMGHLMWVPSETGASYGDLDVQYLTASYRVYLSEADAKKVFAHIKHLQATSPLWNAETSNCTAFIGQIASFMGLKVPFHLQKPEAYVNELKEINGGRRTVTLAPEN